MLDGRNLGSWLARYPAAGRPSDETVGIVMAGNIPLVGFFDLLCVLICDRRCLIKPSSKDRVLIGHIVDLLREIEKLLPESIPYFDPDLYTDKSPRFLAAETIREKAFRLLGDELPYGTAVTIDKWKEETDDKGVRRADIVATLIVDRESHKPIVIGEKGAKLREISRLARADIEEQLGCPVHLEVWVRVRRGWSDDVKALKTLGYD